MIILRLFSLSLSPFWVCPSFSHSHYHVLVPWCTHAHTPHHHTPHTITYDSSWWSQVEEGPPDAIFGLVEAHKKDPRPNKVTLAIGAYRDDKGRPFVLPTVKKVLIPSWWQWSSKFKGFSYSQVEKQLAAKDLDKEYAGIMGFESFRNAAAALAFGKDDENLKNKLVSISSLLSWQQVWETSMNHWYQSVFCLGNWPEFWLCVEGVYIMFVPSHSTWLRRPFQAQVHYV